MRVVTYDDRLSELIGVKLLLLSLQKHCPTVQADVFVPGAPDSFFCWMERVPQATLHAEGVQARTGYSVKPRLLQWLLEQGDDHAVWLDTDIIVAGDFSSVIGDAPKGSITVTEEPLAMPFQGGTHRSESWGLPVGRALPATTNTAVTAVRPEHLALLRRWNELLGAPAYVAAQQGAWDARPIHLMGDQEVLCALLESTEFDEVPIHFLKRGSEIAHCFQHHGYMFHQMIANAVARRVPPFVHCHGDKPWRRESTHRLHLDVSPYTLLARDFAADLDEDVWWMEPSSRTSSAMRRTFRNSTWNTSFPLAAYKELRDQRLIRTGVKRLLKRP